MQTPDNGLARGSRTAPQLHLTVIGIGYLGLTHAACTVDLGHEVLAIDVDRKRIEKATAGEAPFFELGLEPLPRKGQETRNLLREVDEINQSRRTRVIDVVRDAAGGSLAGKRITVLGVAFKPNSNDVRDSPSIEVCGRLVSEGATVSVHDPATMKMQLNCAPICAVGSLL